VADEYFEILMEDKIYKDFGFKAPFRGFGGGTYGFYPPTPLKGG